MKINAVLAVLTDLACGSGKNLSALEGPARDRGMPRSPTVTLLCTLLKTNLVCRVYEILS